MREKRHEQLPSAARSWTWTTQTASYKYTQEELRGNIHTERETDRAKTYKIPSLVRLDQTVTLVS